MTQQPSKGAGVALAATAAVCYGSAIVLARWSYEFGADLVTVAAVRFASVVVLLGAWLRMRAPAEVAAALRRWHGYAAGLMVVAVAAGYLGAITLIPVSLATLVFYLNPLMTLVIVTVVERAPVDAIETAAMCAALAGLALALGVSFDAVHPAGVAMAVLAALAAASVFVFCNRTMQSVDPLVLAFQVALTGLVLMLLGGIATGAGSAPASAAGWALIGGTTAVYVVALLTMFAGLRMIGPVATATVMNLEPITAIALAVALLGERMSALKALGAVIVIAAIAVAQIHRARRAARAGTADPARAGSRTDAADGD